MGMRWLNPIFKGQSFKTTKGNIIEVVEVVNARKVLVKFMDGTNFEKWAKASEVREGKVKSPYDKTFCGVGFLGEGPHKMFTSGKVMSTPYLKWTSMMTRCYRPRDSQRCYADKFVSDEWHNFQNFAEWWETNPFKNESWELDKDLIVSGNKEYGQATCCIVPKEVNNVLCCRVDEDVNIGVYKKRDKFFAQNSPHRVSFKEAKMDYLEAKRTKFLEIRAKYSGSVDERIFTAYENTLNFIERSLK